MAEVDLLWRIVSVLSVLLFSGGIAFFAIETARNQSIGNEAMRKLRLYLANEPVRTKRQ